MEQGEKHVPHERVVYESAHEEYLAEMHDEMGDDPDPEVQKALEEGKILPAISTRRKMLECIKVAGEIGRKDLRERNQLIVLLFYATGVRKAEMAGFVKGDIFDDRRMIVRFGKEDKDRYVLVDPDTMARLNKYVEKHKLKDKDSLFDIGAQQIYNVVVACGEKVGLVKQYAGMKRNFSPHAIRHAWATHSTERHMRPYVLKKLLGHQYMKTTEMYVHLSMDEELEDYDATNPLTHPGPGDPDAAEGALMAFPGVDAPATVLRAWMVSFINSASPAVTEALALLLYRMAPSSGTRQETAVASPTRKRSSDRAHEEEDEDPSDEEMLAEYDRTHPLVQKDLADWEALGLA